MPRRVVSELYDSEWDQLRQYGGANRAREIAAEVFGSEVDEGVSVETAKAGVRVLELMKKLGKSMLAFFVRHCTTT